MLHVLKFANIYSQNTKWIGLKELVTSANNFSTLDGDSLINNPQDSCFLIYSELWSKGPSIPKTIKIGPKIAYDYRNDGDANIKQKHIYMTSIPTLRHVLNVTKSCAMRTPWKSTWAMKVTKSMMVVLFFPSLCWTGFYCVRHLCQWAVTTDMYR